MNITAGIYKGRKVNAPDEKIVRPTLSKAREGIFSVLFSLIDFEGKSLLDMFAGSGIMGLEALSRGFDSVKALEKNPKVARILKENYESIGLNADLIVGDSLITLKKINKIFDVVYIDPPYFSGIYEKSLEALKTNSLIDENSIIILEHVSDVDWASLGFELIKQKNYSKKFVTFLKHPYLIG